MSPLTPWKSATTMLANTRAADIAQLRLPPTLYAPTRSDWGPPDHHAGLDWTVMREAKGPTTQPLAPHE